MAFYSGKSTSFRTDRPEFSFNTQIITCFVFLDKLLHFSESLFSCLKMGFKKKPQLSFRIVTEDEKCTEYLIWSKCPTHSSNSSLISLLFALSVPVLAEWLALTEWWITEWWNLGRLCLGHRGSYLYSSLENSVACLVTHLQWLSQRAAIIDILTTLKYNQKNQEIA